MVWQGVAAWIASVGVEISDPPLAAAASYDYLEPPDCPKYSDVQQPEQ